MSRLTDRIAWCERMIDEATNVVDRMAYCAELAGLSGSYRIVGVGHATNEIFNAHSRGLTDRATLLDSPGIIELGPLAVATLLRLEE